jgi:hypothetical protein
MAVFGFVASLSNPFGFALIALAVIYAYAILSWHRFERWAWWFCLLLAAAMNLLFAPHVIYNLASFAMKDPLYRSSPAITSVVAIEAVVIVLPATLVLVLLIRNRRGRQA